MTNIETIIQYILAALPSLTAVISTVVMILRVMSQFATLKKDVVQVDKETIEKLSEEYKSQVVTLTEEARKAVEAIRKATNDQLDLISSQLREVLQENYELKKTLNETLTKIDKVKRD